jgi:hypothetical protein
MAQFSYSRVFANLDLGSGVLHDDRDWANYSVTSRIRLHAGYHFLRYLSLLRRIPVINQMLGQWSLLRYRVRPSPKRKMDRRD